MQKRLCVFSGSNTGGRPQYVLAARELGWELVARDVGLVYGGASVGLMGVVADAVLEAGGHVSGVIPEALVEKELAHSRLSELRVVSSMHERKSLMADLSDGFIALPGGFGTIEEFFEVLTWGQLGIHDKPCGLLDVCGYYKRLLEFLDDSVKERFVNPGHRAMILVADDAKTLLDRFEKYTAPKVHKWMDIDAS